MKNSKICLLGALISVSSLGFCQASIQFKERIHDFGFVKEGDLANYTFSFENNGSDSLKLSEVRPQCGCTTPNWSKDGIPSGDESEIQVSYNSQGRVGTFYKNIHVTSNAKEGELDLVIKGVVISKNDLPSDSMVKLVKNPKPSLVFQKTVLNFGKVEKGKTSYQEVIVKNTGKQLVKIKSSNAGCNCVGLDGVLELASGESKTLNLRFSPREIGTQTEVLVILTDDVSNPVYSIKMVAESQETLVVPKNILENNQNSGFGF